MNFADLLRFTLVGFVAALSWAGITPRFDGIDPLSLAAAFVGGYPAKPWTTWYPAE